MKLDQLLNQDQINRYADFLKSQGLSDASIKRKLSSLVSFKKFLQKKSFLPKTVTSQPISYNPTTQSSYPITSDSKLPGKHFNRYLLGALILIILSALGIGLYTQSYLNAKKELAYSTASEMARPGRHLSFQGRLTDQVGNPISSPTTIQFKLYDIGTTGVGTTLYDSWIDYGTGNGIGSTIVDPDDNGIFSVIIGQTHGDEIPPQVFSENVEVWLDISVGDEPMDKRQQIATVAYALNAETLQGLPPSASGLKNTVLVIGDSGDIYLGEESPSIISENGIFALKGDALLLQANMGTDGNIEINPDGSGVIKLTTEGVGPSGVGGFIYASNANLSTGNLFQGEIRNDNRGYNFIEFTNYNIGTTELATRFSVNAHGDTNVFRNLQVGSTLLTQNISIGSTIVTSSASEINLLTGLNATTGSIIYGNGTNLTNLDPGADGYVLQTRGPGQSPVWVSPSASVGASSVPFSGITTGTNTQALMTVGSGSSISYTGTGVINANRLSGLAFDNLPYVANVTNSTLIRSGSGPYTLGLNLGATNTWTGSQTFNAPSYFMNSVGLGTSSPTSQLHLVGSGSLLKVGDTAGNTLIDITDTNATFNLPTAFTSTGDVSLSHNLLFTNATASFIKANSPLAIEVGEAFNSSNLTLRTFNAGQVVVDSQTLNVTGNLSVGGTITGDGSGITNLPTSAFDKGNLVAGIGVSFTGTTTDRLVGLGDLSVNLTNTGVDASTYGSGTSIPTFTVDAQGRLTSASQVLANFESPLTFQNGLTRTVNTIGLGGTLNQLTKIDLAGNNFGFYGTGNVGIGTTSPSKKLDISGDINLTGTIFSAGTSGSSGQILSSTGTGLSWIDADASGIGTTYAAGIGLSLASNTFSHKDYTSVSDSSNSNGTVLQSITFDSDNLGHVVSVSTTNLDSRFLQIGATGNFITTLSVGGSGLTITGTGVGRTLTNTGLVDVANGTLSRSGSAGNYRVALNLASANIWSGLQTFNAGIAVSGPATFRNGIGVTGNSVFSNNLNVGGTIFGDGSGITNLPTSAFDRGNLLSGTGVSFVGVGTSRLVGTGDLKINLTNTGVTASTYGSGTSIPTFTVDAQGRITSASQTLANYDNYQRWFAAVGATNTAINSGSTLSFTAGSGIGISMSGTTISFTNTGIGTTYAAGVGLTLSSDNIFSLNLGSSNVWTARQIFTGGIGVTGATNLTGNLTVGGTFVSVGSTNLVTNLNADLLNGLQASSFLQIGYTGFFNTALNGLQAIGSTAVGLGGTLTQNTSIGTSSFDLSFLGLGNTQSLFLASSGYVGIGNTNPTANLDIKTNNLITNNLVNLNHTQGFTSNSVITGDLLNINRSLTANISSSSPPTLDNSTTNVSIGSTHITYTHTVVPGSNRILMVQISSFKNFSPRFASSVTFNGVALTKAIASTYGSYNAAEIWYLIDPPTGTLSVDIYYSSFPDNVTSAASTWFNVNQTTPIGSTATSGGSSSNPSLSISSTNTDVIVDVISKTYSSTVLSPGAGQTTIINDQSNGTYLDSGASYKAGEESSTTMSWTHGSGNWWAQSAVSLKSVVGEGSLDITSSLANLTSQCNEILGNCVDTSSILSLNQFYSNATGSLLNIGSSGAGNLASLNASNPLSNGLSLNIASTSPSQYALQITTGTDTIPGLYLDGTGNLGLGLANPSQKLDVLGNLKLTGTIFVGAGVTGSNGQVLTSDGAGSLTWTNTVGDNWGTQVVEHDTTLTGSGTSASPLALNLASANTWTALQTFTGGIGVTGATNLTGNLTVGGTFASVGSTNLVTNLNADLLDGLHASSFIGIGSTGNFITTLSVGGSGLTITGTGVGRTLTNTGLVDVANGTLSRSGSAGNYRVALNLASANIWSGLQTFTTGIGVSSTATFTNNVGIGGTLSLTGTNVGVGTTVLYVNSAGVVTKGTLPAGTTYTAGNGITLVGNEFRLGNAITQNTRFNIGSTEVMYFQLSSGNVGIGTTDPSEKLSISGNATVTGNLNLGSSVDYGTGKLNFDSSLGTKINLLDAFNKRIDVPSFDTMRIINEESGASNQYIEILADTGSYSRIDLGSHNDSGEIVTPVLSVLTGTGKVGIGTTDPSEKLSVSGNAILTGNLAINGGSINSSYGIELGSWGNNTRGTNFTGTLTANDTTLYGDYRTLSTGAGALSSSANYRIISGSYNDITVNTIGATGAGGSVTRHTEGYGAQNNFNLSAKGARGIGLYNNFNFSDIQTRGYGIVNNATFSETGSGGYIGVLNGAITNNGITSLQSSGPAMITGITTSVVMEDSFSYLRGAETYGYLENGGSAYGSSNYLYTENGGNLRGTYNELDTYGGTGSEIIGMENYLYGNDSALDTTIYGTYNWIQARGNNSLVIGIENDISVRGIGSTVYGTKTLAYTSPDSLVQTSYGAHLDARANDAQDTAYALYLTASGVGKAFALYSDTGINYFGGNVGIGTTNPTSQLHVVGNGNITNNLTVGSSLSVTSLTSNRLVLGGGSGNLTVLGSGNSGQFLMSNGSNAPVWSTVSGGVGTTYNAYNGLHLATDPNQFGLGGSLDIGTSIDLNGNNLSFVGTGSIGIGTSDPGSNLLQIKDPGASFTSEVSLLALNYYNGRGLGIAGPTIDHDNAPFNFITGNSYNFRVDTKNAFTIDHIGNVGVNTTKVPHRLTVDGTQSNISFNRDLSTVTHTIGTTKVTSGVGNTFTTADVGKFLVKDDGTFYTINSYIGSTAVTVDQDGSGSSTYTGRVFNPNFFVASDGKVGIGTALPRKTLEVGGNLSAARFTDLTDYDKYYLDPAAVGDNSSALSLDLYGSVRFNAQYDVSWTYIKNGPSNQIRSIANGLYFTTSNIGTAGNTITGETGLFLSASAGYVGNVGIGTTNPTYKLDVIGEIRASGTDISPLNPGTSTNAGIYHGQNMGHLILDLNNNDANDAIAFRYSSANDTTVDTVGFVMKGNGRVGIGTTSPAAKLEVSETTTGITSILGRGNNANFNINVLQDKSSNSSGAVIGEIGLAYNTTKNSAIRFHRGSSTTGGYMTFTTNNGNQQMMIDANGNVGIGTIPSSKLHVYNNIAGNSSTDKYNLQSTLDIAGTHPTIRAFDMRVNANAASGTIANIQGNYTQMSVNSNASVTEIKNYSTWGTKAGTGTVGNWSLYDANNPSRTGGTITNLYGLKIDNLTAGTNNWSIYTGSAQSYFGGSVGIGNPNPTAPLDVAGDIKTNGYYVNQCNSANVSSAGWYRIASNGTVSVGGTGGSRAHAKFTVWDTDSGQHSASTFYASYHYGNSPTITLQSRSYYSGGLIDKVRIVEGSTYEGAAVEIYINGTVPGDVYYCMYDNVQSNGWTPVDWTAGSLPGGFAETKLDLDTYDPIMAGAANGNNNAFHIDRSGNAFFNTLDTGNGNFEINSIAAYLGNQNLRTTDSPTFNNIYANGSVRASSQLISTVANGTAPLAVSSTTVVSNLNADRLDGYHGSSSNTASTYALRDSSGDIITRLFRSEYTSTNASVNYIMTQVTPGAGTNNYLRPSTPTQVRNGMGLGTAQTPTFGGLVSNGDVTLNDKVYITDVNNRGWGSILIQGRVIQTNQHNLHLAVTNSANYVGWGVAAYDSASAPATGKLLGNGAIQILNTGSQPAATDCDSSTEWGRIQVTTGTSRGLEVCLDNGWYHIKPGNNDLAENFPTSDPTLEAGDVVKIDINLSEYVSKADKPYDQLSIGFVSTNPGQLLGSGNPGKPIALSGRVPVKVFTTENKSISHGDYITSSYLPGIASKAYKAGSVLGKALDKTTNWSSSTCPTVTSINNINWPEDAEGNNSSKPCFRVPVNSLDSQIKNSLISHGDISANTTHIYIGKIMVYVENSWQDPNTYLTDLGEVQIDYNIDESVMLGLGYSGAKNEIETATYSLTDTLGNTVSRIGQFSEIAAAKIKTGLISAKNIVTDNIISQTSISKETQTSVISPLSDLSDTIVIDGKTNIKNDLTVDGNTAISGQLSASNATISGTLYVDTLISREGSISEIMTDKISSLREEIRNLISSSESTSSASYDTPLLAESETWSEDIFSESIELNGNLSLSNNLVVGAKLTVLGDAQLGNAFITGTFTAGQIAIQDNFLETTNTALYIQPSGLGSVHLMGDTLVIAENGQVIINGNLHLTGDLVAQNATFTGSLMGNLVQASEASISGKLTAGEISTDKINVATGSATIIAEGGFAQLATSSAKLATNATAGTATLPAGKSEIVIYNQSITSSSMVYLTPAGSTGNQVPYLKSKYISPTPTPESGIETDDSYFIIALDQPLTVDTDINWWIIN